MVPKKFNILFLTSWYPNKIEPKNGNFIQQHAIATSKFCNVAVLHVLANNQDEDFQIEERTQAGVYEVIVYYKKIKSTFPVISQLLKLKKRRVAHLLGYNKILNKIGAIDVCHLNIVYPSGDFALYLKNKFKIPYIISENWTSLHAPYYNSLNLMMKKLISTTFDNASVICPVSEDLKKSIQKISTNNNYQIVPNVVNTDVFYPTQKIPEKRILHISNLKNEHKNITGILDTIKELSKIRTDFKISIIGDGDYEYFIKYAKKINLPENLYKIEGAKSYHEVAELMRAHDMFLLYSNYENLPCVIAEALVCGLPILTSNVGGTSEMVNETNGIIVPPANNIELLKQLNSMLDNLNSYKTNEIANVAKNKYCYESVGRKFLQVYQNIINSKLEK